MRPVVKIEQRIAEANKLGFERIYVSKYNLKSLDLKNISTEVVALGKIEEIIKGEKSIFI